MSIDRRRRTALLKVLAAAAWADGRLEAEEVNHLKDLMRVSDLDPAETGEVEALLRAPVSYARCQELTQELLDMLGSDDDRREVLDEVEALFRADGSFDDEERVVLESLEGIMDSMSAVDGFMSRITGVFRRVFSTREGGGGDLTDYLKNAVLHRLDDLSGGRWRHEIDAADLNRYTLFGAVLGKVADVEEGKSEEELDRIRRLLAERFDLRPPLLDWTVQAVAEAVHADMDRQALLSEYNRIADMSQRRELLDAAFAVAAADGAVATEELQELRLVSNFLWIDPRDFNEIRRRWRG